MALADYVIAVAAGVIVAAVVILASLLSRYSRLVKEANESTKLAKDVWDSVNSRFSVVDTRIIDLMAKTEVLASRSGTVSQGPSQARGVSAPTTRTDAKVAGAVAEPVRVPAPLVPAGEGSETEEKVLMLLAQGPKTSAQIKAEVGRSREHTARLMKILFDRGLVMRNDRNKPYVYEITEKGRSYLGS